jgi:hypothetical protein
MAYQKLQAYRAFSVSPNDNVNIPSVSNQDGTGNNGCVLYVGTGGNLDVTTAGGDRISFNGVVGGTFIPVQVVKVWAAGTTASDIVALW